MATIDHDWPSNAVIATKYQHTDALGSPVAVTNTAGVATERTNYEPYGAAINKTVNGIGYTGHVLDGATGLTYMQQRYYDPGIGRFLSVDPVTAYDNGDMRFFNRYAYAFNSPYKFTDPDGRCPVCPIIAKALAGGAIEAGYQHYVEGTEWAEVDRVDVAIAAVAGVILPGSWTGVKVVHKSGKQILANRRAIKALAQKGANTTNRAAKNANGIQRNVQEASGAAGDAAEAAAVVIAAKVTVELAKIVNDEPRPPPPPERAP